MTTIRIYVTWERTFLKQTDQHFYDLENEATFLDLKTEIYKDTGVEIGDQILWFGVPGKFKIDGIEDYSNEGWTLGLILTDQVQLSLKGEVKKEKDTSHCGKIETDLLRTALDNTITELNTSCKIETLCDQCFIVQNFLNETECKNLISIAEEFGFQELNTMTSLRTNTRVILGDEEFSNSIFNRIRSYLPVKYIYDNSEWEICRLNPSYRFCRYTDGQKFEKHCDSFYSPHLNEISFYTVNIYLNNAFNAGHTRFFLNKENKNEPSFKIKPSPGLALIFNHLTKSYLHDGEPIENGLKYIMRTDVMYKRILLSAEN